MGAAVGLVYTLHYSVLCALNMQATGKMQHHLQLCTRVYSNLQPVVKKDGAVVIATTGELTIYA